MSKLFTNKIWEKKIKYFYIIFYCTILVGFYFEEDTLGGAKHDYEFHLRFIIAFKDNFTYTLNNFGVGDLYARNSPIFYIFLSFFNKVIPNIDLIRLINSSIALLIYFTFLQCLEIRFPEINKNKLTLIALLIFLSPTIRSLSIWPYSYIWALLFFLISIKNYLLFCKSNKENNKFIYSLKNTFYLVASAYLTPNFSVFCIFFLIHYYKNLIKINFLKILLLNIILSIPAIAYSIKQDFYFLNPTIGIIDNYIKYNFANKIVLITSIFFFYLIPFINFNKINNNLLNYNCFKKYILIIFFIIGSIYFFNYPAELSGGGVFFKTSNLFFNNNNLLYVIFVISIFTIYSIFNHNYTNYIIFFLLIIYNLQFSIYTKYFDPLVLITIFLLLKFKINQYFFDKSNNILKLYSIYIMFLILSFFKITI